MDRLLAWAFILLTCSLAKPFPAAPKPTKTVYQDGFSWIENPPTAITKVTSGCLLFYEPKTTFYQTFPKKTVTITGGDDVYCTCADGGQAQPYTTRNEGGVATIYCPTKTGLASNNAPITTLVPSADPGSAMNPAWANVSCNYGSLTDIENNPWRQWNDSGAGKAWEELTYQYMTEDDHDLSLSGWIGNFFHTKPGLQCQNIDNTACDDFISCGTWQFPNADVSSPAGYIIVNSMIAIHTFAHQFSLAMADGVAFVNGQTAAFTSTFSPVVDLIAQQQAEKNGLAIVSICLGLILAPTFASLLSRFPFFKQNPNYLAILDGISGQAINGGITFALVQPPADLFGTNAQIEQYISNQATALSKASQKLAAAWFSDIDSLGHMISKGKYFNLVTKFNKRQMESEFDISQTLAKTLFANALPMVWTLGPSIAQPFIATSSGIETDGCTAWDVDLTTLYDWNVDADDDLSLDASLFCDGDTKYYLLSSILEEPYCGPGDGCINLQYKLLISEVKGLSELNGKSFGGLKAEDVVFNAVNNWRAAGYSNQDVNMPPLSANAVEKLEHANLRHVRGLVSIPVCSLEQAGEVMLDDPFNDKKSAYWPCPEGKSG